jgi:nucleoid DNA-binding protein
MRKLPWLLRGLLVGCLGLALSMTAGAQSPFGRKRAETLPQRLAREAQLSEKQADKVLEVLGPIIRDELTQGRTVTLQGLGTFEIVRVAGHKDIEFGTGRVEHIPARNTIVFLASGDADGAANAEGVVPVDTVPAFEYIPLPGRTARQRIGTTRSEGIRTR